MDNERLAKLAEWLEGGAKHERITFDMRRGFMRKLLTPEVVNEDYDPKNPKHNQCATSCCIAGMAVQLFNEPDETFANYIEGTSRLRRMSYMEGDETEVSWDTIRTKASNLLGADTDETEYLFRPDHRYWRFELEEFNDPAWAARTIRHLIETGDVDWAATSVGVMRERMTLHGYLPDLEAQAQADDALLRDLGVNPNTI